MNDDHAQHDSEAEQQLLADVAQYGCHFPVIEADDYSPAFGYSIGFYQTYQHPEIICFGLPTDLLWSVLEEAHARIKAGEPLLPGQPYPGFLDGYDVRFVPVEQAHFADYFGYAHWFYKGWNFPALQLVWPDKQHRWPWEEDFNSEWKFKQPLLDRNTDFKFREERNLGVFTTQAILDGQPILRANHDEDGDWLFWGDEPLTTESAKIVCLEELVQRDPSLNKLHQLNYACWAWRDTPDDDWQTEETDATDES